MDILDLERTVKPEWWLKQIADCDWAAGPYLYTLLKENRFHALCGETARVLLLVDGTKLASFCTYAEQDDIPDTDLTPWMGFVYTHPDYRGRRLMGKLICRVKELARNHGYDTLYISTGETGLYEKYGAEYITNKTDRRGGDSRIYRMDTYGFFGHETAGDVKAKTAHCGPCGRGKPVRRGCGRTGRRKTAPSDSAPLPRSWPRTFSAAGSGASRWRRAAGTATTLWTDGCLT